MSSEIAISAEGLGKHYFLGQGRVYKTLRDTIAGTIQTPMRRIGNLLRGRAATDATAEPFWAVRDVSFDLERGQVLGVIGRNGSGKSTLLKVLSRITEPSAGRAVIRGRVGSLLEVGTGFHAELSGRENIFLSGATLGMARSEIVANFDEIVAFAEVDKFIDTPVKHYSSGMYLRLAFAVAAHLEPEILLVDEVLAVGDREFQKKCLGKMEDVASHGRTIFFVSHNMMAIESMCDKVLILDKGKMAYFGPTDEGVKQYQQSTADAAGEVDLSHHQGRRDGSTPYCQCLRILNRRSEPSANFALGDDIIFEIDLRPNGRSLPSAGVTITLYNNYGQTAVTLRSDIQSATVWNISEPVTFRCRLQDIRLAPGRYAVSVNMFQNHRVVDFIDDATSIDIDFSDIYGTGQTHRLAASLMHPSVDWDCRPLPNSQLMV